MMPSSGFTLPGQPYPGPQFAPQFASPPTGGRPAAVPSNAALAQQQGPPRPIIRAQAADDVTSTARPAPIRQSITALHIPSPEQLGVFATKPSEDTPVDWAAVHNRLNALGAACFHMEKVGQGSCRITCLIPTNQQGHMHRIEAQAANEAEAIRLTLSKADDLAGR
jgi:hypothetical protein